MKILNGAELAGFIKERQAHQVRGFKQSLGRAPRLVIIRDSDNPVIMKYVGLKARYGTDIGVEVEDCFLPGAKEIAAKITEANADPSVSGIIIQLPLVDGGRTEESCELIAPEKDVDGLTGSRSSYDSATATAILWLLAGYDISLDDRRIAVVGRGKLVGAPLYKMLCGSGYEVELFHRGSDLTKLRDFDIIISATGVPGLVSDEMVGAGAVVVDAGTASEDGVLKGDVADSVRERKDLAAITPVTGGVGPLTIAALFEHVIQAT